MKANILQSAVGLIEKDVKDAISGARKNEYLKELSEVHDLTALRIIEHRMKTDDRLTECDRMILTNKVEFTLYGLTRFGLSFRVFQGRDA